MNKSTKVILHQVILFLFAWIWLLPNVASHITAGDSGELALAGATLGVAHSPGYPVFVLLNHVLGGFFYFGNPAFQQNLASLFFLCLSLSLFGWLLFKITDHIWTMYVPGLLLLSPYFRHQAYVTEVFPLTVCFAVCLLLCTTSFFKRKEGLLILSFFLGLGLAVHQTLLLIYPAVLFFYVASRPKSLGSLLHVIPVSLLFFILGLSVHLYLPMRSFAQPVLDWEDPQTWDRFWGLVTRERYGFFQLAQGEAHRSFDFNSIWASISFSKDRFVESFGWFSLFLLILGTIGSLAQKDHRRLMIMGWGIVLLTGPFFFWMAEVHKLPSDVTVLDRFVLLPSVGSVLVLGLGASVIWGTRVRMYRGVLVGLLIAVVLECGLRQPSSAHGLPLLNRATPSVLKGESMRWDLSLREMGLNALRQLPANSILFADRADEFEFVIAFLKGAEGRRRDIQFVDCNASVSRSIYGDDYYRIWGRPRLAIREKVEGALLDKTERPVFYATVDPTMINLYRVPWGFLYRAIPLDRVKEHKTILWDHVLLWRFLPNESRSMGVVRSNLKLMGQYMFDRKEGEAVLHYFGLAQLFGGIHRYEQIGFLYQIRQRRSQARDAYEKAIASGGTSASLFSNYGLLLAQRGLYSEAIDAYEKGIEYNPESVSLLYNLSTIYWRTSEWTKVTDLLGRVLEIDPKHEEAALRYPKAKSLQRFVNRRDAVIKQRAEKAEKKAEEEEKKEEAPAVETSTAPVAAVEDAPKEEPVEEKELTEDTTDQVEVDDRGQE